MCTCHMSPFVLFLAAAGSLIKLGEYDGAVLSFEPATGLYAVRILQVCVSTCV